MEIAYQGIKEPTAPCRYLHCLLASILLALCVSSHSGEPGDYGVATR